MPVEIETQQESREHWQRAVSSTEFAPGDLVAQRKTPHVVGLVVDTQTQLGRNQILEVMCGADTVWWRAKGCVKVE